MKRLYYITKSIDAAERLSERLKEEGIDDSHFHVLGKDKANIVRHHLRSTTPIQELDIIRSGERGVMLGITVGVLLITYISFFTTLGSDIHLFWKLAAVLLFACFGAWVGGLVGVNTENYKIKRFHRHIEQGSYLLLIDIKREEQARVMTIASAFSSIREAGMGSTIDHPFTDETVIYKT